VTVDYCERNGVDLSLDLCDASLGWTVDIAGRIYRSTNGGQSWCLQFHAGDYLSTLQFFDAQRGWAIGGDTFLRTTDGGQSWVAASVPQGTRSHAARFADPTNGVSVGEFGNLTVTSDGGTTWMTAAEIGSGPHLLHVESWSSTSNVRVGEAGELAMSSNGGSSWTSLQSGGTRSTHAIDAVDALHTWAANDGGEVLRTVDGGNHRQRGVVAGFDHYGYVKDVDFIDPSLGWAVGRHEFFGPGIGRIARSTDGGASWEVQHSITGAYMEAVEVLDAATVLVLGQVPQGQRFILRSTDAGASWTNVSPKQAILMDSEFVDPTTGWVVGGQIYKSSDGGISWNGQHTPSEVLYSVSFFDALHGWAVGWGPTILHTTNGGTTWTPQSVVAPTSALFAVEALGPHEAWIAGGNGFFAHEGRRRELAARAAARHVGRRLRSLVLPRRRARMGGRQRHLEPRSVLSEAARVLRRQAELGGWPRLDRMAGKPERRGRWLRRHRGECGARSSRALLLWDEWACVDPVPWRHALRAAAVRAAPPVHTRRSGRRYAAHRARTWDVGGDAALPVLASRSPTSRRHRRRAVERVASRVLQLSARSPAPGAIPEEVRQDGQRARAPGAVREELLSAARGRGPAALPSSWRRGRTCGTCLGPPGW